MVSKENVEFNSDLKMLIKELSFCSFLCRKMKDVFVNLHFFLHDHISALPTIKIKFQKICISSLIMRA